MPGVTIWLDEAKIGALSQFAMAERRRVADQAAVIIENVLAERDTQDKEREATRAT